VRAGANCSAADSFTGRTPLHELAAAAAAAEMLGPSRGAAAGFILNMLLHASVEVGFLSMPLTPRPQLGCSGSTRVVQTAQHLPTASACLGCWRLQHCWLDAGADGVKGKPWPRATDDSGADSMPCECWLQANVCDAAGMTPAQLAAGSAFAALLPAAKDGCAATCSGRPCSRCDT
jgi:hypothetical protein